jgi:hypothetical protein
MEATVPIELPRTEAEWLELLCPGNPEAQSFIRTWARYCHEIDDVIDGERPGAQDVLGTFALSALVYSHPFFLRNVFELRGVALVVANMYADSVEWEKSDTVWQRQFADCYRHAGNEMVLAVARLCGGWEHARRFSLAQRMMCWSTQHEQENQAYGGNR